MKHILTILLITLATSIVAQSKTKTDTINEDSYTTHDEYKTKQETKKNSYTTHNEYMTKYLTKENSYVTHTDSEDSLWVEMTPDELDELNCHDNYNDRSLEEIYEPNSYDYENEPSSYYYGDGRDVAEGLQYYPQSVLDNINQNAQDYRNFYYRKQRTTLLGLLLP